MSSRRRASSPERNSDSPTIRSAYSFCSAIQARVSGLSWSSSQR